MAAIAVPPYITTGQGAEAAELENALRWPGPSTRITPPPDSPSRRRRCGPWIPSRGWRRCWAVIAPLFHNDADVAAAVSRVSITGGFAAVESPSYARRRALWNYEKGVE
jgi:hypothetical protein